MENDFEEKDFGEALTEFCLSMNHNKVKDEVDTSTDVPIELTDLSVRRYETRIMQNAIISNAFIARPIRIRLFGMDSLCLNRFVRPPVKSVRKRLSKTGAHSQSSSKFHTSTGPS